VRVRVFYHGKCFDGTASAALFSRFYSERILKDVDFQFTGLVHRAGALFDENDFDGDENVIVDFKYSPSPRITWWFDHHQSAFLTPEDIAQEKFGFDPRPVSELIHWANIIDGAKFESPQQAVEMAEPAMKLTMVIESTNDNNFLPTLIPYLVREPLAQVIQEPFVATFIPSLLERHRRSIDILRGRSECKQGTIYFDISDHDLEGYNKFIPYYLHPDSVYSVGLSSSSFRVKVSVGSNPWTDKQNMVNLAKICERYGGGGHARVGAISFPPGRGDDARKAAAEIVQELRASES
jgi:hypothetical protein